LSSIKKGIN